MLQDVYDSQVKARKEELEEEFAEKKVQEPQPAVPTASATSATPVNEKDLDFDDL